MRAWIAAGTLVTLATLAAACGGGDDNNGDGDSTTTPAATGPMVFESAAFGSGQPVPAEYTCDGDDTSPPLTWSGVPTDAESLALEMIDRDADGFIHWLVFDIPPDTTGMPAAASVGAELGDGAKQAINTFGDAGYGGPCPPPGEEHEYVFRLYALDVELGLEGGGSARNVQQALADHILALSELAALYSR